MNTTQRVNHKDYSDQELVDLFRRLGDRVAVAELYERYRVLIGNYLYRDIKNKVSVADTFNTIMLDLISNPSPRPPNGKVSVKLFTMAYTRRLEYTPAGGNESTTPAATLSTKEESTFESKLAKLSRPHADVIELAYKYNFSVEEVAQIIGDSVSVVRNRLSYVRELHQPFIGKSDTSKKAAKGYIGHAKSTMLLPKRRRLTNTSSRL